MAIRSLQITEVVILMTAVWLTVGCPAEGKVCADCIRNRMEQDCPACAPPLRCMAQCLWGGDSRSRCVNRCDSGGAWASLASCKQCITKCKCRCSSSSFMSVQSVN
uniref:Uncharacterized protein n=1 Tax=Cucumis sativus TaxID=3659 RepID=A0A0A0LW71_CUCSA